ncbi:hypothetical protein EVAR_40352_1 [Eumeta japonica]|uniref:Uncharacterized protein n=1 Tax=Eumeta variegata TaxID=151549 RepID=A0A4C1XL81_EUMVA|nr:hypothetical protein EVAR_40352_1 [Eumeta japonica]
MVKETSTERKKRLEKAKNKRKEKVSEEDDKRKRLMFYDNNGELLKRRYIGACIVHCSSGRGGGEWMKEQFLWRSPHTIISSRNNDSFFSALSLCGEPGGAGGGREGREESREPSTMTPLRRRGQSGARGDRDTKARLDGFFLYERCNLAATFHKGGHPFTSLFRFRSAAVIYGDVSLVTSRLVLHSVNCVRSIRSDTLSCENGRKSALFSLRADEVEISSLESRRSDNLVARHKKEMYSTTREILSRRLLVSFD